MSRKHDVKRLLRRHGLDSRDTARKVRNRQQLLANWIESQGGAEAVHLRHLSAIVAAKPKRKGRITRPDNPYRLATIEDYDYGVFVITLPPKRGTRGVGGMVGNNLTDRETFDVLIPQLGGVKTQFVVSRNKIDGKEKKRTIYVLPKNDRSVRFVRQLSVFWG